MQEHLTTQPGGSADKDAGGVGGGTGGGTVGGPGDIRPPFTGPIVKYKDAGKIKDEE